MDCRSGDPEYGANPSGGESDAVTADSLNGCLHGTVRRPLGLLATRPDRGAGGGCSKTIDQLLSRRRFDDRGQRSHPFGVLEPKPYSAPLVGDQVDDDLSSGSTPKQRQYSLCLLVGFWRVVVGLPVKLAPDYLTVIYQSMDVILNLARCKRRLSDECVEMDASVRVDVGSSPVSGSM